MTTKRWLETAKKCAKSERSCHDIRNAQPHEVRKSEVRKLVEGNDIFNDLANELRLVRVTLDKHEIAGDKTLQGNPLQMGRMNRSGEFTSTYEYRKEDLKRGHIMGSGLFERGSVAWEGLDANKPDEPIWVERRDVADRFLAIFMSEEFAPSTE